MSRAWFATPPAFLAEVPKAAQIPPPTIQSLTNPTAGPNDIFAGWSTTYYLGSPPSYTSADVTYDEPHLYPTGCSNPGVATWSGIGSASGTFGQDGTWSLNGMPNHQGFWQVWLNNVMQNSGVLNFSPAIVGGNVIRANVNYQTYNKFYGTVTNVTTGQAQGWSSPLFAGQAPNTAEALVEKLASGPGPPYDLANFRTLTVTSATGNGQPLPNDVPPPLMQYNITNGTSVANTSAIDGNGGFTVLQKHC